MTVIHVVKSTFSVERLIAAIFASLFVFGCQSACPPGYEKMAGFCKAVHQDGGTTSTATNGATSANAGSKASDSSTSSDPARAPASASHDGGITEPSVDGGGGSNASNTNSQTPSRHGGSGSSSANGSGGTNGSATDPSAMSSATPGTPGGTNSVEGPCQGHAGAHVCDGAVLHRCDAGGASESQETCMTPALCQAGAAAGACAVCSPGAFRCNGTELDLCTDAGQYMMQETCATAALCKEDAGQCTPMMCMPNVVSCSSDGSTLNTCNADGSAFASKSACPKGCNQKTKACNNCMPGETSCSGNDVATCSPDGQTMLTTPCMAAGNNDCVAAACSNGRCTTMNKPTDAACGNNGKCDGRGACNLCGNGTIDPGEGCDYMNAAWVNFPAGCDHTKCTVNGSVYRACSNYGDACWPGSYLICSPVGICTAACTNPIQCLTTDQAPNGLCTLVPGTANEVCTVPCSSCPSGTHCTTFTDQGTNTSISLCGTRDFVVGTN